jgi:SAM-dependent methyltransferase
VWQLCLRGAAVYSGVYHNARDPMLAVPPAEIRYRIVNQAHSEDDYLTIGRYSVDFLRSMLGIHSDILSAGADVLDFGCGCARTIQPLHQAVPYWRLYGTDIDRVAIEWNRANIDYAEFSVNGELPPLRYSDQSFDLVYALSVCSHLPLAMQAAWLAEFGRILRPRGLLYITFHGQHVLEQVGMSADVIADYEREGFAYIKNIGDGVLPDWYQTSFQKPEIIVSQAPKDMAWVASRSAGHGRQDDILMVKTPIAFQNPLHGSSFL